MQNLYIDLETFSRTDIKAGVYRYSEDPDFLILMAAWSLDGSPVKVAITEDEIRAIPGLQDPSVLKVAHNARFDRVCLSRILGMPTGTYLNPVQWHDTMAVAAEQGLPQSLKELAQGFEGEQKDEAGTRLINLFCKPARSGLRVLPEEKPEEWRAFVDYCAQDVVTLMNVDLQLGGFPTRTEHLVWLSDQRINDTGIKVDLDLVQAAVTAAEENQMLTELEISRLTGVTNPSSQPQMLRWFRQAGLDIGDLQAETIAGALKQPNLDPLVKQVLGLRQELALVASMKYTAALKSTSEDGRLRGGFRFFGAHTGRWAGSGVQLHNLPRASLESEVATEAAILDLRLDLGADPFTLKALVRSMFTGPFTVVDYSSIEARVISWLAGEGWALEAFTRGRDIYVETAERMGGLTRSQGKVAVLALGYNGGVGSLRAMGAEGSDDELQKLVDQWRTANPAIVDFWKQMGTAFIHGGPVGDYVSVEVSGDSRIIHLPSGRGLAYHGCKFDYVNTLYGPKRQPTFKDPKKRGLRVKTYGGRLTENVTQAVARDILAEALVRLHEANYQIVGHVHDEILVEGVGTSSVAVVSKIMNRPPTWADGLPINSDGFTCHRYRKG